MHKFGSEYFNSTTQNKKWGVREWFNTVSQSIGGNTSVDMYSNYSLAHVYLPSTPNGGGPFVETGYYKGYGSTCYYVPAWYYAYQTSSSTSTYWEVDRTDVLPTVGTLHLYTAKRTGHYSNGDTQWTFCFDGSSGYSAVFRLSAPDQGYPLTGGEILQQDSDVPNMNAQGRNNGTGSLIDYLCFMDNSGTWNNWNNTNYSAQTSVDHSAGISFVRSAPYYSYFDATGH